MPDDQLAAWLARLERRIDEHVNAPAHVGHEEVHSALERAISIHSHVHDDLLARVTRLELIVLATGGTTITLLLGIVGALMKGALKT